MKKIKHTLFLFTFAFLLLTFSISFAQLTVKDSDANVLLKVNDYGFTGTVTLPPFIGIAPSLPINNYMLYNIDGTLYFNNSALGTSNNAAGWTRPLPGGKIYTSDLTDNVGIGTNNPQSKLSVGSYGYINTAISGEELQTGNVTNYGGYFKADGDQGRGVHGVAHGSNGRGVLGYADGSDGRAVAGYANGTNGRGVYGYAPVTGSAGYFDGNVQINGTATVGFTGTPFLEIREITGTTGASGNSIIVNEGLPEGWTGTNTRLLSLEIHQSSNNIWVGQGGDAGVNTGLIYTFFYDDSRKIVIHYPEFHPYWDQPWRAVIMKMP